MDEMKITDLSVLTSLVNLASNALKAFEVLFVSCGVNVEILPPTSRMVPGNDVNRSPEKNDTKNIVD